MNDVIAWQKRQRGLNDMKIVHQSDGISDISKERGFSITEYKVLKKDMTPVFTTKDKEKAERMAKEIGGYVHASR